MGARTNRHYREMTVANIRERKGASYVEVAFLESARFYRLLESNPAFDDALRLLRAAMAVGRVLRVGLASPGSDVIEEVREPGA
jgi:hypothetical protein